MNHIITTLNLSKNYFSKEKEQIAALKKISINIDYEEIVGIVGPNGAGKSTFFKLITGILSPSEGQVKVFGNDPILSLKQNAKYLGVLFGQNSSLWKNMTIKQNLNILAGLYDYHQNDASLRIEELTFMLNLETYLNKIPGELSLGERMKCEIAATVLHSPKLLLLDEPSIGLDIINKKKLRDFLKDLNNNHHTTILLSSHDLYDIQSICSRIIIFNHGDIIFDGNLNSLEKTMPNYKIFRITSDESIDTTLFQNYLVNIRTNQEVLITVTSNKEFNDLIDKLRPLNKYLDFSIERPSLEQVIGNFYN